MFPKIFAVIMLVLAAYTFQGLEGDQAIIMAALPLTAAVTFLLLGS
jgi:hypothetical protein